MPSRTLLSNALSKSLHIETSFQLSLNDTIRKNIQLFYSDVNAKFFSIKMDELAITQRLRWNCNNNQIVGSCYNHKNKVSSFDFNNILNLVEIKNKLTNNEIHLAKESLLITIAAVGVQDSTQKIILNLPVCCHKNGSIIEEAIQAIVQEFNALNPLSSILNIATDGDPNRRKAINSMRSTNKYLSELKTLKHFEQQFLLGEFGVNYDPKHIIKRLRSAIIGNIRFN